MIEIKSRAGSLLYAPDHTLAGLRKAAEMRGRDARR